MIKEKKILLYFIAFILGLFTTMLVGISDVFALTYNDIGYLYDRSDVTIEVTYETSNQGPITVPREEVVYTQFKVMNVFISNYQFQANRHYQIEMEFPYSTLIYANSYQVYDQNNNSCSISYTYSQFTSKWSLWDFSCPYDTNSIYLKVYNTTNTAITEMANWSWNYTFLRYTDAPIDSTDSENTDKIINNNNANTDKIIESNKETQEVIKEQFNTCSLKRPELVKTFNKCYITTDGLTLHDTDDNLSVYVYKVPKLSENYIFTFNSYDRLRVSGSNILYDNCNNHKTKENYVLTNNPVIGKQYNFTSNYEYIYVYLSSNNEEAGNIIFETKEICTNKLDETNDKLQGIQGALTDSSTPNLDSLEDSIGWLPPGPVDSILNLPLTMLHSLTNSLTKTCSPLNLSLPYVNKNLQIPCLSAIFAQITGVNGLWTWVGTIASVLILYNYLLNLYAWVDKVLTLRAEFDEAMGADLANWGRL